MLAADEVPPLLTPTVAEMIAELRTAGLHFLGTWQLDARIDNPKVRKTLTALLQHRLQFRCGDEDAREHANLFQVSYDDRLASDTAEVRRQRIGPAALMNLPDHYCACRWIVDGRPVNSFIMETKPLSLDAGRVEAHLARQRERGGFAWSSGPSAEMPNEMPK